jgi:hypothetical protein
VPIISAEIATASWSTRDRYRPELLTDLIADVLPVRWAPGEAWAFIDGDWKRVDSSDVGFKGREIDEEFFASSFGTLKALPAIAFQDRPDR